MSKPKKSLGLFSIYLILWLILGEIGLRFFLPFEKKRNHYFLMRDVFQHKSSNIRFDPELGFFNNSNLELIFDSPDFRTKITTNSQGFRDDEESLANPAILLLGDSFGFGWGVENNKACASFLEELTGETVLNMGVSGFGTIQEFLLLKRFSQDKDMRDKIAIFLFCPNDLRDNVGHGLPYPTVYLNDNGLVGYRRIKEADLKDWLIKVKKIQLHGFYRYSYLVYGIRASARKINQFMEGEKDKDVAGTREEEERVFNLVIRDIKSFSQERGMPIVFVYIPNYILVGPDEKILGIIKPILDREKIPFLDLRSVLEKEDYWRHDEHWRVSGHFKSAQAIKRFLKENNILE